MNLKDCHNFADFRKLAKKKLPSPIFHYIDGAADDDARRGAQVSCHAYLRIWLARTAKQHSLKDWCHSFRAHPFIYSFMHRSFRQSPPEAHQRPRARTINLWEPAFRQEVPSTAGAIRGGENQADLADCSSSSRFIH